MKGLLEFEPIQRFLQTSGEGILKYFGNSKGCIIYLKPHGTFYGHALHQWLLKKGKKNIALTTMEDNGEGLEEKKAQKSKILIVDGEIITGTAYKRSIESIRSRKEKLEIQEVKFATYIDRVGFADFSVWRYSPEAIWRFEQLDGRDLKIIELLSDNGRVSFAEISKRVQLSQVAVKTRIDNLVKNKILSIKGMFHAPRFYTMSADIQIDADAKTVDTLIEKLRLKQEVYHLAQRSGKYSLAVSMLAQNLGAIDDFIEAELRQTPGVKQLEVCIGELPVTPQFILPRNSQNS